MQHIYQPGPVEQSISEKGKPEHDSVSFVDIPVTRDLLQIYLSNLC